MLRVTSDGAPVVRSRYVRAALDIAMVVVTVTIIVRLNFSAPAIVYKTF